MGRRIMLIERWRKGIGSNRPVNKIVLFPSGMAAEIRKAIKKRYFSEAAFRYLLELTLSFNFLPLFARNPTNWCNDPKGHTHPQKNLPNITVRTIVSKAQDSPLYIVWVVSNVPIATRGSSWRIRLTGHPLNCHHSVPKVETTQNHINKQKKNTWLILLTVTILILDRGLINLVNRISFPSLAFARMPCAEALGVSLTTAKTLFK
jgi:hypothetical protein